MRRWMAALAVGLCGAVGATALAGSAEAAGFAQPAASDWRAVDADNTLVIDTNQGRVIVELYPQVAPVSAERIKVLTRQHFYDGLTFFRVIEDFMDQTGDPKNSGEGDSSLPNVPAEFTFRRGPDSAVAVVDHAPGVEYGMVGALPVVSRPLALAELTNDGKVPANGLFCPGVIGMARAEDPNSGNSQFFLMRGSHASLNGMYTAFGRVVVGEDVVRKIKLGEPVAAPQDRMLTVQILADMPGASRPQVSVIDTRSAYFANLVQRTKTDKGDDFTICDVDVAGQAK